MRHQRLDQRLDRVAVLLLVLGRVQQGVHPRLVVGRVAAARRRTGQDPGDDPVTGAAHQQLRRRAHQPADRERPAVGVARGQPGQHGADVDVVLGDRQQVVGEHDLVQVAGRDPGHRRRDGCAEAGDRDVALGVAQAAGRRAPARAPPAAAGRRSWSARSARRGAPARPRGRRAATARRRGRRTTRTRPARCRGPRPRPPRPRARPARATSPGPGRSGPGRRSPGGPPRPSPPAPARRGPRRARHRRAGGAAAGCPRGRPAGTARSGARGPTPGRPRRTPCS